ncbi:hypothetical protein [Mesorhizobium sp.]|uniref:hypothetical protein n=1 Tax=Mesorhizobium sp. TaxID=1871066 RepID=UPI0025E0DBCC|nr:hypothetical protein [Mesorhizobium sp.]
MQNFNSTAPCLKRKTARMMRAVLVFWLRGHATTDTDIRWSWRFDTSGHFAWINVVAWMRTQFIDFVAFFWEKIDSFPHIVPNGPAP